LVWRKRCLCVVVLNFHLFWSIDKRKNKQHPSLNRLIQSQAQPTRRENLSLSLTFHPLKAYERRWSYLQKQRLNHNSYQRHRGSIHQFRTFLSSPRPRQNSGLSCWPSWVHWIDQDKSFISVLLRHKKRDCCLLQAVLIWMQSTREMIFAIE
jgi:hypothetical protein